MTISHIHPKTKPEPLPKPPMLKAVFRGESKNLAHVDVEIDGEPEQIIAMTIAILRAFPPDVLKEIMSRMFHIDAGMEKPS